MALKIYNKGNLVAHVSTTSDIAKIKIPIDQEYVWPKNQMFYSFVDATSLFTIVRLHGWEQKEIAVGIPFTDFLDGDDAAFASSDDLRDYLENILGSISNDYAEEIALGNVPNMTSATLFGHNPNIANGTEEVITEINGDDYPYLSADTTLYLSSSDDTDTQNILITGMDDDYERVLQSQELTGQTAVAIDTDLFRVFSLRNIGSTVLAGDVYITSENAHTAGVPDDLTKVLAKISIGSNATNMGLVTTATGEVLIGLKFRAYLRKNQSAQFSPYIRALGGVFIRGLPFAIYQQAFETKTESFPVLPEKTDLEFRALAIDADAQCSVGVDYRLKVTPTTPEMLNSRFF